MFKATRERSAFRFLKLGASVRYDPKQFAIYSGGSLKRSQASGTGGHIHALAAMTCLGGHGHKTDPLDERTVVGDPQPLVCEACRAAAATGQLERHAGAFYCDVCWQAWESSTHSGGGLGPNGGVGAGSTAGPSFAGEVVSWEVLRTPPERWTALCVPTDGRRIRRRALLRRVRVERWLTAKLIFVPPLDAGCLDLHVLAPALLGTECANPGSGRRWRFQHLPRAGLALNHDWRCITPGGVSRALAHRAAWERFAALAWAQPLLAWALILEDTVMEIASNFGTLLESVLCQLPENWDVCLLGGVTGNRQGDRTAGIERWPCPNEDNPGHRLSGYLVSVQGAQRLLRRGSVFPLRRGVLGLDVAEACARGLRAWSCEVCSALVAGAPLHEQPGQFAAGDARAGAVLAQVGSSQEPLCNPRILARRGRRCVILAACARDAENPFRLAASLCSVHCHGGVPSVPVLVLFSGDRAETQRAFPIVDGFPRSALLRRGPANTPAILWSLAVLATLPTLHAEMLLLVEAGAELPGHGGALALFAASQLGGACAPCVAVAAPKEAGCNAGVGPKSSSPPRVALFECGAAVLAGAAAAALLEQALVTTAVSTEAHKAAPVGSMSRTPGEGVDIPTESPRLAASDDDSCGGKDSWRTAFALAGLRIRELALPPPHVGGPPGS